MSIEVGTRVLVTTDNWFFAPDGRIYRGVYGTVKAIRSDEATLGVKTNARATNWYAEIGDMTIAGCQIHYAVRCASPPPVQVEECSVEAGVVKHYVRPSQIYNADKSP